MNELRSRLGPNGMDDPYHEGGYYQGFQPTGGLVERYVWLSFETIQKIHECHSR